MTTHDHTIQDVADALRGHGDNAAIIQILERYGVRKLKDLDPSHYDAVMHYANRPVPKRHPLRGRHYSELADLPRPKWVVPERIPEGITVIYSTPKRGKSFYCIELSLCIAAGALFHGLDVGKARKVLYVAAEGGAAQVGDRAARVIAKRELDADLIEQNWVLVSSGIDLNRQQTVDELLKENASAGPFDIVILDTLARNMSGDENSTREMNEVVRACDYIRKKMPECKSVILLHHSGWLGTRPRGAIVLFAALDCLIRFERDEKNPGVTKVLVEEMRDAVPPPPDYFSLDDGTLDKIEGPATGIDKLAERERKVRDVLVRLCSDAPGGIEMAQWKAACETDGLLEGRSDARKKQWQRATKQLFEAGLARRLGLLIIPLEPDPAADFQD